MNEKLTELKAKAYDALANIEAWQKRLQELNMQIAEKQKEEAEKKVDGNA